jgi:hypothetical protein
MPLEAPVTTAIEASEVTGMEGSEDILKRRIPLESQPQGPQIRFSPTGSGGQGGRGPPAACTSENSGKFFRPL